MIHKLIAEYDFFQSDDEGKCRIVESLIGNDDPHVLPFLLRIAGDKAEYDLARIEALRGVAIASFMDQNQISDAARVITDIIADQTDDTLVRQWAAKTMYRFTALDLAIETVRSKVLDNHENVDVRFNLLTSLASNGSTPAKLRLLEEIAIAVDGEIKKSALRMLGEWR